MMASFHQEESFGTIYVADLCILLLQAVNEKLLSNVILENIIVIQVQIKLIFQVELLTLQYDGIISPRGEFWNNKTSLTLLRFIEVSVPSQESDWSCRRGIYFALFYDFSIEF
jgi:hypothetical protein